jgi:hypothetical protein
MYRSSATGGCQISCIVDTSPHECESRGLTPSVGRADSLSLADRDHFSTIPLSTNVSPTSTGEQSETDQPGDHDPTRSSTLRKKPVGMQVVLRTVSFAFESSFHSSPAADTRSGSATKIASL